MSSWSLVRATNHREGEDQKYLDDPQCHIHLRTSFTSGAPLSYWILRRSRYLALRATFRVAPVFLLSLNSLERVPRTGTRMTILSTSAIMPTISYPSNKPSTDCRSRPAPTEPPPQENHSRSLRRRRTSCTSSSRSTKNRATRSDQERRTGSERDAPEILDV